jgi:hypothetical protein
MYCFSNSTQLSVIASSMVIGLFCERCGSNESKMAEKGFDERPDNICSAKKHKVLNSARQI